MLSWSRSSSGDAASIVPGLCIVADNRGVSATPHLAAAARALRKLPRRLVAVPAAPAPADRGHLPLRPHGRRHRRRRRCLARRAPGRPARLPRRTRRRRAGRRAPVGALAPRVRPAGPQPCAHYAPARRPAGRPAERLHAGHREDPRPRHGYADRAELLDYCRRSANPVGRLLLHLYGVHRRARAGAERRHLQRAAAHQLLAGPERRPAARPPLPAARPTVRAARPDARRTSRPSRRWRPRRRRTKPSIWWRA